MGTSLGPLFTLPQVGNQQSLPQSHIRREFIIHLSALMTSVLPVNLDSIYSVLWSKARFLSESTGSPGVRHS